MLEEVKCNSCNSKFNRLKYVVDGFKIVKCGCGLVFVNPRLKNVDYSEEYFKRKGSVYEDYLEEGELKKKSFRRVLNWIKKFKKGKLLDVGCGSGEFLDVAKENFNVKGVDIFEVIKREDVVIGDFGEIKFDEKFDVVTMFDYLEHSKDPFGNLKKVNNILTDEGILVVVTGNIDSWFSTLMGKKWNFLNPLEHLYYFSEKSLRKMLDKSGFEVVKVKKDFRYVSLRNFFRYFKLNIGSKKIKCLVWLPSMIVVFARKK